MKILKYQICMKIRSGGTELFHADGRIDSLDEANSRFSQFCDRALRTFSTLQKEGACPRR